MRRKEPNIFLLIALLQATDGEFFSMEYTVDEITAAHLEKVYVHYQAICESVKDEEDYTKIAKAFEELVETVKIDGFYSRLYYDLNDYLCYLQLFAKGVKKDASYEHQFIKDMRRVKIILNRCENNKG